MGRKWIDRADVHDQRKAQPKSKDDLGRVAMASINSDDVAGTSCQYVLMRIRVSIHAGMCTMRIISKSTAEESE